MRRPQVVQIVALLLSAAFVIGAASMIPRINEARQDLNILGSEDDLLNAPPEYAFAVQAFGAFRSIITNIAFIRAEKYKNAGRYYDAFELAEWICKLQPYFPTVWEFHGWNMSWNISVTTFTPEERWHWVYNGIKLVRDQGIRRNPRAVNLYKQLAWTFFNKIGGDIDEFHTTYKRQWAWRMHLVMGPPPVPYVGEIPDDLLRAALFDEANDAFYQATRTEAELTRERIEETRRERNQDIPDWDGSAMTTDRVPDEINRPDEFRDKPSMRARASMVEMLREIEEAPDTLAELHARVPETRQMVADLWSRGVRINDDTLDESEFLEPDGLAGTFFWPYRQLATPGRLLTILADDVRPASLDEALAAFDEIVGVTRNDPAGRALLRFLQRKVLTEAYNMDPAHMHALVRQFGAMDWRLAETQGIYWVTKAVILAEGTAGSFENDKTNTFRILLFSLQSLARRNKVFFDPVAGNVNESYLNMLPDPSFITSMHHAYLRYAPRFDWRDPDAGGAGDLFRSGHINFLEEGIRTLYFANRIAEANELYAYLQTEYGRHPHGAVKERYTYPLREFVELGINENITLQREMVRYIRGLLMQALMALSGNEIQLANSLVTVARNQHTNWNAERVGVGADRLLLPPFLDMYADVLQSFLSQPAVDYTQVVGKSYIWITAPLDLRQIVYDDLYEQLAGECEFYGFEIARAFPEPPGMDEYRERSGTRRVERDEPDSAATTPVQAVDDK
jgi:tetratricopeptide (TPR) repeat protein